MLRWFRRIRQLKQKQSRKLKIGGLRIAAGSKSAFKRVGRGDSSGIGKTCGRGHKGQKSRSGGVKRPGFEGGQTPLYRRLPKLNRFKNFPFKKVYAVVNLDDLGSFKDSAGPDQFIKAGFARRGQMVKILGRGKLSKALTVSAHAFSESAKKAIEAAGGKAEKVKA